MAFPVPGHPTSGAVTAEHRLEPYHPASPLPSPGRSSGGHHNKSLFPKACSLAGVAPVMWMPGQENCVCGEEGPGEPLGLENLLYLGPDQRDPTRRSIQRAAAPLCLPGPRYGGPPGGVSDAASESSPAVLRALQPLGRERSPGAGHAPVSETFHHPPPTPLPPHSLEKSSSRLSPPDAAAPATSAAGGARVVATSPLPASLVTSPPPPLSPFPSRHTLLLGLVPTRVRALEGRALRPPP